MHYLNTAIIDTSRRDTPTSLGNTDMSLTAMQVMQKFHKLSPDRSDTYKKMQKSYLAGKVRLGLFTDSETVIDCDQKILGKYRKRGYFDGQEDGSYKDIHNEDRVIRLKARNLDAGTRLFGTWRNTASVYKIDESIAPQALSSLIPLDTPSDIYMNLPEWAVYFEMPTSSNSVVNIRNLIDENGRDTEETSNHKVLGFWATHDRGIHEGREHTCLDIFWHFDLQDDARLETMFLAPFRLLMTPNMTVVDSVTAGYGTADYLHGNSVIRQALSLLLWLCVEEPDVTNIKGVKMSRKDIKLPRYARSKQSGAFVPPMQERHLEIAKRMGGEVREWNKEIDADQASSIAAKRKAPHIRRGHWTGVWIGSGASKDYKVYWQKPLFINAK